MNKLLFAAMSAAVLATACSEATDISPDDPAANGRAISFYATAPKSSRAASDHHIHSAEFPGICVYGCVGDNGRRDGKPRRRHMDIFSARLLAGLARRFLCRQPRYTQRRGIHFRQYDKRSGIWQHRSALCRKPQSDRESGSGASDFPSRYEQGDGNAVEHQQQIYGRGVAHVAQQYRSYR